MDVAYTKDLKFTHVSKNQIQSIKEFLTELKLMASTSEFKEGENMTTTTERKTRLDFIESRGPS